MTPPPSSVAAEDFLELPLRGVAADGPAFAAEEDERNEGRGGGPEIKLNFLPVLFRRRLVRTRESACKGRRRTDATLDGRGPS